MLSLDLARFWFEGSRRFVLPSIRRLSDLENSLRSSDKRRESDPRRLEARHSRRGKSSAFDGGARGASETNRLPIYPPNRARRARFLFQIHPFEAGALLAPRASPRASSIRQTKRSHSHLNLYSHVQHTRDYECVGLMKPGKASAFAPPTAAAAAHPPAPRVLPPHTSALFPSLFLFILRRLRHFPTPPPTPRRPVTFPSSSAATSPRYARGSTAFRG